MKDDHLLETLFERMSMGVAIFDQAYRLRYCNAAWRETIARYISSDGDEIVPGKTWFELFPGTEAQVKPVLDQVLQGETVRQEALRMESGGVVSYRDVVWSPLFEDGQVVGVIDTVTDVTDDKLARRMLGPGETILRSLLESARDFAIYRLAADPTHPHGARVEMVSPSLQEIVGIADPYDFGSWFAGLHPEDLKQVAEENRRAWQEGKRYDRVARFYHAQKKEWVWVHTISTPVLDDQGRVTHCNGFVVDVTEQKRAEAALRYRLEFENIITTISTHFINLAPDEIDAGIHQALQTIGEFTEVDRSYVFLFSGDQSVMSCTHEWCAQGITPQIERLQEVPVDAMAWTNKILFAEEVLHLPRVADMPPEARADQAEFEAQDIVSLISVPMVYRGSVIGFLGFDAVRSTKTWSEESIALLKIVGETVVNALEHKRAQAIQVGQRQFLELLATGGAFSETLDALVHIIEEQWPGMLGLVLLLDEDGQHLHHGASLSLPQDYVDSIEGLQIGPLVGSCGTASYCGERVIVEDIAEDPRWEGLRDLALQYGLRACWSQPVFSSDGRVIATFAMYYRHPRAPTEAELHAIEVAAHLVGVAVEHRQAQEALHRSREELEQRVARRTAELREANALLQQEVEQRKRAEKALRRSETKYRELVENANSIILQMDPEGKVTFFNRFAQEFFGYSEKEILGRSVVGTIMPATDQAGQDLAAQFRDLIARPERYYSSENENVRRDGERVWVAWTNKALYDEARRLTEVLSIGIDRTEQKRAEEALAQREKEKAAAAERNRLARDLHDAVSQTLFSASLIAEVLPRLWERDPVEGRRRLEEVRQLTRGAMAEMRTLLLELRPTALAEADLGELLKQLAEAITGRARVPVSLHVEGECPTSSDVKVAFYRIAQEALNNVAKHAAASQVDLHLRCSPPASDGTAPGRMELCVCDNGRGFDPHGVTSEHLGLGIMRERAESVGAALQVDTRPGDGTRVTVVWTGET